MVDYAGRQPIIFRAPSSTLDAKAQVALAATYAAQAAVSAQASAAAAAGRIYASYAAGNAATTTGQYFFVAASGAYDLYLHGTATPVAKLPTINVTTGYLDVPTRAGIGGVAPDYVLHAIGNSVVFGITATVNRGGGDCLQAWYDNAGRKGFIAYGGGDDAYYVMNDCTAPLFLGTSGQVRWRITTAGDLEPQVDNARDAGSASSRIKTIHLVNSPSVTSDEREKDWRGAPTEVELRAAQRIIAELGFFQWKTEPNGPLRFGARAQKVRDILEDEGLLGDNPARYGLLGHHEWTDVESGAPRDRYSLDPDQLSLFLIAAQEARIAALEA